MIEINLSFLAVPALLVALVPPTAPLALTFESPPALPAVLVRPAPSLALAFEYVPPVSAPMAPVTPSLALTFRPLQTFDAALLPVLVGPTGPQGPGGTATPPTTRSLTWAAGRLTAVAYADGRSKALTYTGDQLTRVDRLTPSLPTQRAELAYNPDGTLAGVTESIV